MYIQEEIFIRNQPKRKRNPLSKLGTVLFVVLVVLLNYWVFLKDTLVVSIPGQQETVQPPPAVEIPPVPEVDSAIPVEIPEQKPVTTIAGQLKPGETVLQALQNLGVDTRDALPVVTAMESVLDFRSSKAGDSFKIELDANGKIERFEYKQSHFDMYIARRSEDGKYVAKKKKVPTEVKTVSLACAVKGSLYRSFRRCGSDPKLASLFMNLFVWDFNLFEQAKEGDVIRLLVEKIYVDGKFLDYGRILAAQYDGLSIGHKGVYYFKDPDGIEGYYDENGKAIRKEFLKVPLDYASSTRTKQQKYTPKLVRRGRKMYYEYPGPMEAAVWSVASGTVTFAGKRKGQGFVVEIQHSGGYTSTYSHLASLASGVTKGAQVFQKSIIGKLGRAKKKKLPTLYFSLRKGRKYVDHMKENFPGGEPVSPKYMDQFRKHVNRYIDELRSLDILGVEDSQA